MNFDNNQTNSIPEFYNGKSVFITGGTGFLGKVLVEKLLRSCPKIENVYLLVRNKKGKNVNERFDELIKSKVFDILREKDPQAFEKIILIQGDTSKVDLGISNENQKLLCDKVSVIFNAAANVKFIGPLKEIISTNLKSLQELIKLSRQIKDLKSVVHISTAYSNWFEPIMKEQFYPAAFDPHYIIDLVNSTSDDKLKEMAPKLFGKHVNVYTFTKGLAEHLALQTAKDLPFVIVRPSVVGASIAEPHVGWTDSYTAGTPLVDQSARGVLRAFHCNKNIVFDVIPVDMVINLAIAVSWKKANDNLSKLEESTPNIYNSVSGNTNSITIQQICQYSRNAGRKSPSDVMRWYPQTRFYKTRFLFKIDTFLTHYIPAMLSDFGDKLTGNNGNAVNSHKKVLEGLNQIKFVMNNPINFHAENYQKLLTSMNKTDRKVFYFDPKTFNWRTYIDDFYFGIRKFIYNDKSVGSAAAQKKLKRLKYMNYILTGSIFAFSLITIKKVNDRISRQKDDQISSPQK